MRNLPLLLIKNTLAAKMKRGIRSFCNGNASTSTMNQRKAEQDVSCMADPSLADSNVDDSNVAGSPVTLEQMLLQLELEEAAARRANLNGRREVHRRMSCVNNSDILRTARNALSQHPRFSLDGRDAMYRSSFRNHDLRGAGFEGGRRSVCCSGLRGRPCMDKVDAESSLERPSTVGGESVMWCKPGVVARLMGLDVVPVPIGSRRGPRRSSRNPMFNQKQNSMGMGKLEMERKMFASGLEMQSCKGRETLGSHLAYDHYCMMNPSNLNLKPVKGRGSW